MASTLPPQSSAGGIFILGSTQKRACRPLLQMTSPITITMTSGGMVFVPPTKRNRTASGKTNTFTPTRLPCRKMSIIHNNDVFFSRAQRSMSNVLKSNPPPNQEWTNKISLWRPDSQCAGLSYTENHRNQMQE